MQVRFDGPFLLHGCLKLDVRCGLDGVGGRTLILAKSGVDVEIVAFLDAGETLDDRVGFGAGLIGVRADLDLGKPIRTMLHTRSDEDLILQGGNGVKERSGGKGRA